MSEDGKNIVSMFSEMRKVCQEVSQLLRTCDSLFKDEGWNLPPKYENVALTNHSAAIYAPAWWLPYYVFRFYKNKSHPGLLAFVSAIFDNANDKKPKRVEQALLTAGWCDYGNGKDVSGWEYYYASVHIYIDGATDDGEWYKAELQKIWPKEKKEGVKVSTFAIPLIEITDTKQLREKVVLPLTRRIEQKKDIQ